MKTIIWVVVSVLIIFGIWRLAKSPSHPTVSYQNTSQTASSTKDINSFAASTSAAASKNTASSTEVTVNYTGKGFSPKTISIKRGGTVKFVNQSSKGMWVAVNNHPTHTLYDGTSREQHCAEYATPSFDSCRAVEKSGSYSFTFEKVGTWGYHNHSSINDTGTVVVK